MSAVKVIGDLKITTKAGGNPRHGGFWHSIGGCHIVKSGLETILCSPPVTTWTTYYSCGYWEKERHETIKVVEN